MDALVSSTSGRAVLLCALLLVVSVVWWVRARGSGVVHEVERSGPPPVDDELLAVAAERGLGTRATFLQISSSVCSPCRRTASVLSGLAAARPGVKHVELDAAEHLPLVRHLGVLRTPTVLVLDAQGHERGRSSGAMTLPQARAALDLVPQAHGPQTSQQQPADETRRP